MSAGDDDNDGTCAGNCGDVLPLPSRLRAGNDHGNVLLQRLVADSGAHAGAQWQRSLAVDHVRLAGQSSPLLCPIVLVLGRQQLAWVSTVCAYNSFPFVISSKGLLHLILSFLLILLLICGFVVVISCMWLDWNFIALALLGAGNWHGGKWKSRENN